MKNKTLFVLLVAVAVTLGGVTFYKLHAAPPPGGKFGHRPIMQRVMSELNLSEEQLTKIKAELRAEKDQVVPLLEQLHAARKDLRETIQANGDEAAIRAAHSKVADVEEDLAVHRAKVRGKIAPILTDEQHEKLKVMEEKMDEFVINAIRNIGSRLE